MPESSRVCNFIKMETLAQVFSSEYCEFFKNAFFNRAPLVTVSVLGTGVFLVKPFFCIFRWVALQESFSAVLNSFQLNVAFHIEPSHLI